ncbi:MAG TPA: hypothetical protein VFC19_51735 [Candidatus Limnocylindrales bacterium]|nr:hypothetical protein [Candidatus Limnocylindrales bacterium]
MTSQQTAPSSKPRLPRQRDPCDGETIPKQDNVTGHDGGPEGASTRLSVPGMARYLTDPAIEAEIQAFIASAPPLPEEKRARLARLLRTKHCHHQ